MALFWKSVQKEREKEYIGALFQEHKKLFYSIAKCRTSSPQDAEDMVQQSLEELIKISSKFVKLSVEEQLSYVKTVICHNCIDLARKRQHHQEFSNNTTIIDSIADESQDFVEQIEAKDQVERLLSELNVDDQIVLAQRYVLDASTAEISAALHCNKDNIYMRLSRARDRAKEILIKKGACDNER